MYKIKIFSRIKNLIRKELINIFFISLACIFFILDLFIKKKKKLIVFSQKNNLYSDNSKSFFEFININQKDFEAVWFVHNLETKKKILLENKNAKIKLLKSLDGIKTLLEAKTVVTSNSLHDFFPYFIPSFRKEAIQLWHGIKWTKHFEYPNNNFTKQLTIICASSESHKELIYKQNVLDPQKVYVTGLPRNDKFFQNKKDLIKSKLAEFLREPNKKIILYAPTQKEDLVSSFFPFKDINIDELNKFLEKENFIIFLRPHINDTNKDQEKWKNLLNRTNVKNIKPLSFKELEDINLILPLVNILITDYSTIYTDSLLLNIPTIFIPYDYDIYEKKRGFVYKFDEIAVGPKVFSQKEFLESIIKIKMNRNHYINIQEKIKKKFHLYEDGLSSNRIIEVLNSKLNK